jgi:hypothetical protein
MRQLGCMSTDIYCQITNNNFYANHHFYTGMERRGKGANCQRDRERERVCKRRRVAENGVGICCKNGCWKKD